MSRPIRSRWDPGSGAFGRLTGAVYWLLAVEVALLAAASPGLVGVLLLDRDPSNIPLYALCVIPFGPALSGAVFALRVPPWVDDFGPWRRFWRGWRMNLAQVLAVWVPTVVLVGIAGFNLAFSTADGFERLLVVAGAVLAAIAIVWAVVAVVVVSLFRFRTGDAVRIVLYAVGSRPLVALGVSSLLLLAAAVVAVSSDWVLAVLGSLFALALVTTTRPALRLIRERFIAGD